MFKPETDLASLPSPQIKSVVYWTCRVCGKQQKGKLGIVLNDDKFTCRSYDKMITFMNLLQDYGWELNDTCGSYINSKSKMKVKCSNGHDIMVTHNFFQQGHGCKHCTNGGRVTHTLKDAIVNYGKLGYTILDTQYKTGNTPMKTVCVCGHIFSITHFNVIAKINRKQEGTCEKCTGRWKYIDVKELFEKNGCEIISIDQPCEYPKEDIHYIFDNPPKPGCDAAGVINADRVNYLCFCGNKEISTTTLKMFRKGARCAECTQKKRRETCIRVYGCPNAAQNPDVQERIREKFKMLYGVDHNMKTIECVNKARQTNIANHGGRHNLTNEDTRKAGVEACFTKTGFTHPLKNPEVQKNIEETCLARLGVRRPLLSPEIHKKIRANNLKKYGSEHFLSSEIGVKLMVEKYGNKCFLASDAGKQFMINKYGSECFLASDAGKQFMVNKYGSECFLTSDAGKQLMIEKYGMPYAMQNSEIFRKAMAKAFSMKDFVFPSGRTEQIQGYEHFALNDLIDFGVDEGDILVGSEVPHIDYYFSEDEMCADGASSSTQKPPKKRRYYPDIYVKANDTRCALIIEVKSTYTLIRDLEKNIAKFDAVDKQYSNDDTLFALWVYDKDGTRMDFSNPLIAETTTNFQM